jgi:hypothetical protein
MKKFVIKAEAIEKVIQGHCIPWNYDYKEYIFNDNFTEAYSIRIPINTNAIRAMLYSNGSGIKDEYDVVYIDNGEKVFDIDNRDELIKKLIEEIQRLKEENNKLQNKISIIRNAII